MRTAQQLWQGDRTIDARYKGDGAAVRAVALALIGAMMLAALGALYFGVGATDGAAPELDGQWTD